MVIQLVSLPPLAGGHMHRLTRTSATHEQVFKHIKLLQSAQEEQIGANRCPVYE